MTVSAKGIAEGLRSVAERATGNDRKCYEVILDLLKERPQQVAETIASIRSHGDDLPITENDLRDFIGDLLPR